MKSIYGLELPQTLAEWADPARAALLVYDMQIGICRQVESGTVIAGIRNVLASARAAGMRVVYTRHLSLPTKLMGRMAYRTAMAWQHTDDPGVVRPWFLRDTPGFAVVPDLAPRDDEAIIDKITMSAFEGTPLEIILRDCGLQALAICGIAMEIGIEPTVRHAADLGFVPIVIADACGHGNPEAAQRGLDQMRFTGDAMITDIASFTGALAA